MMRIITSILFLFQTLNGLAHHSPYPTDPYPAITITVWNDTDCGLKKAGDRVDLDTGSSWPTDAAGENVVISTVAQSYWLSRDLINDERLDWSHCADPTSFCKNVGNIKGPCTSFLIETSPDSNRNALNEHTCYLLDPGGAQVSQFCLQG